jgi:hypothetical protein
MPFATAFSRARAIVSLARSPMPASMASWIVLSMRPSAVVWSERFGA